MHDFAVFVVVLSFTIFSSSLGKTLFVKRFILNENILFWLSKSYQKAFVFFVSVFCSQIFTLKLNLLRKIGLCKYNCKVIFWNFNLRKYFFSFLG